VVVDRDGRIGDTERKDYVVYSTPADFPVPVPRWFHAQLREYAEGTKIPFPHYGALITQPLLKNIASHKVIDKSGDTFEMDLGITLRDEIHVRFEEFRNNLQTIIEEEENQGELQTEYSQESVATVNVPSDVDITNELPESD